MFRKFLHTTFLFLLASVVVAGTGGVALYNVICNCSNTQMYSVINQYDCCHSNSDHHCEIADNSHAETSITGCCSVNVKILFIDSFDFQKYNFIKLPCKALKSLNEKTEGDNLCFQDNNFDNNFSPLLFPHPRERLIFFHQLRIFC